MNVIDNELLLWSTYAMYGVPESSSAIEIFCNTTSVELTTTLDVQSPWILST